MKGSFGTTAARSRSPRTARERPISRTQATSSATSSWSTATRCGSGRARRRALPAWRSTRPGCVTAQSRTREASRATSTLDRARTRSKTMARFSETFWSIRTRRAPSKAIASSRLLNEGTLSGNITIRDVAGAVNADHPRGRRLLRQHRRDHWHGHEQPDGLGSRHAPERAKVHHARRDCPDRRERAAGGGGEEDDDDKAATNLQALHGPSQVEPRRSFRGERMSSPVR